MRAKFEIRSFSFFGAIFAFNARKFMGSRDPGHALFSKKKFRGHVGTIPEARVPNLKSVSLAILELLAFNA